MQFDDEFDESTETIIDFELPPRYKVILLNDDFTTKDFVVYALMRFFHKSGAEAEIIMESVHKTGKGIAGIYDYDIAATRAKLTMDTARENGFPLKCILEKE